MIEADNSLKVLFALWEQNEGGANRNNLCRVRSQVCKLKSGPGLGQVYAMRIDKTLQYFHFCLREWWPRY